MTLFGQVAPIEADTVQLSPPTGLVVALLLATVGVWIWAIRRVHAGKPPLAYEGRQSVPWNGSDVAVIFLSLTMFVFLCQGLVLFLLEARLGAGGKVSDSVQAPLFASQSISELCVMLLTIGLLMQRRKASWQDLGFDLAHVGHDLVIGIVGFLFIATPVQLLYALFEPKQEDLHPLVTLALREPSLLWLIGFCAVVVAPLVEEFFFRVVLQGWLERRQRSVPRQGRLLGWLPTGMIPILISSALFAGAHAGQWPAPVPLFFLALVLGYLYHQTHRLLPSLVVHTLLNASTFLNLWWAVHSGAMPGT